MVLNCALKLILPSGGAINGAKLWQLDFSRGDYVRDIARAGTFGFTRDVEKCCAPMARRWAVVWTMPIVMDDYKVLNSDGLRYGDEFCQTQNP